MTDRFRSERYDSDWHDVTAFACGEESPQKVARLVVDALHESVAQLYRTLGFTRVPGRLMLVQKISDSEAAFASH